MAVIPPTFDDLLDRLKSMANPDNVAGMARFGINPQTALGVSVSDLRKLAKGITDHRLAAHLWATGIHEARMLAAMVDDPKQVTLDQMEAWVADFDSWDLTDTVTGTLFDRTPFAVEKAHEWSAREEEFVRRAGFALIAWLAVHNKQAPDRIFIQFLPLIERQAGDPRNYVKKAVSWALRSIGKRHSPVLYEAALRTARGLSESTLPAARWVGRDAVKELEARAL